MKNYFLLFVLLIVIVSCADNHTEESKKGSDANDYARLFSVVDSGQYYRLDIFSPWQGGDDVVISYYLSEDIAKIPGEVEQNRKIVLPVKTCVCLSTTHVAMISACASTESILGVSGSDYVSDTELRLRIEEGLVADIGYDSNLNTELIASLKPDVVLVYGIGPESASYLSKLETVGIPTLYICDYLETHPLAKAEWLKLFGLLFGEEESTGKIFSQVRSEYEQLRDSILKSTKSKPKVMLGLPFRDTWFISPGNSYISQLIEDAGGEYIWAEVNSKESMPLGIESVFREALESEYWLNIGNISAKDELLGLDYRFGSLSPVINNKLYNNTLRLNRRGGNDYWESGAIYPNLILKDIASILHPEIIDSHVLQYYKRVE